jgi:hypothetical protein
VRADVAWLLFDGPNEPDSSRRKSSGVTCGAVRRLGDWRLLVAVGVLCGLLWIAGVSLGGEISNCRTPGRRFACGFMFLRDMPLDGFGWEAADEVDLLLAADPMLDF